MVGAVCSAPGLAWSRGRILSDQENPNSGRLRVGLSDCGQRRPPPLRDLGRGFRSKMITEPGSLELMMKTLAIVDKVTVGTDPNAILFDKKTQSVFTADRGAKRVTA